MSRIYIDEWRTKMFSVLNEFTDSFISVGVTAIELVSSSLPRGMSVHRCSHPHRFCVTVQLAATYDYDHWLVGSSGGKISLCCSLSTKDTSIWYALRRFHPSKGWSSEKLNGDERGELLLALGERLFSEPSLWEALYRELNQICWECAEAVAKRRRLKAGV